MSEKEKKELTARELQKLGGNARYKMIGSKGMSKISKDYWDSEKGTKKKEEFSIKRSKKNEKTTNVRSQEKSITKN